MKRSVTLISVSITAFSVVLLASVFYAVRAAASTKTAAPVTAISNAPELQFSPELAAAAEVASPRISPQAAVTAASEFLSRTDAFSVQLADYNGQQAYLVTFSSGDLVYVSLQGQILGSVPAGVQMASSNRVRQDRERDDGGGDRHQEGEREQEHESEHETEAGD